MSNLLYLAVRAEIKKIVDVDPQFIYQKTTADYDDGSGSGETCLYVHIVPDADGKNTRVTGCALGRWLHDFQGVTFGTLIDHCEGTSIFAAIDTLVSGRPSGQVNREALDLLTAIMGENDSNINPEGQTAKFLQAFQGQQDEGYPYIDCYVRARADAENCTELVIKSEMGLVTR